ncbi:MAG: hypothetical protein P8Z71_09880 [Candidatus Sulfobium sp.]
MVPYGCRNISLISVADVEIPEDQRRFNAARNGMVPAVPGYIVEHPGDLGAEHQFPGIRTLISVTPSLCLHKSACLHGHFLAVENPVSRVEPRIVQVGSAPADQGAFGERRARYIQLFPACVIERGGPQHFAGPYGFFL